MSGDTVSGTLTLESADQDTPMELLGLTSGQVFGINDYSIVSLHDTATRTPVQVGVYDGDPDDDGELIDTIVVREGRNTRVQDISRDEFTDGVYVLLEDTLTANVLVTIGGEIATT